MSKKNQHGFTIIEIVIAFVLIGIIAGIAAAKYFDLSDSSGASVCRYNRGVVIRTLLYQAILDRALSSKTITADEMDDALKSIGAVVDTTGSSYKGLCPTNKENTFTVKLTYSDEDNSVPTITVACSEHDADSADLGLAFDYSGYLGDPDMRDQILTVVTNNAGAQVDSGAAAVSDSSNTAKILAEMEETLGFTMADVGATSWQYLSTGYFIWTDADISTMNVGDTFPVIRYNINTGTYTVWMATVTTGTTSSSSTAYNIISKLTGSPLETDSSKQTFENAVQLLKETQAKSQ